MTEDNTDSTQFEGNLDRVSLALAQHVHKTIEAQLSAQS